MQKLRQAVGSARQAARVVVHVTVLLTASIWSAPAYAACGDSVIDGAESCDDGNAVVGDGCNRSCQVEAGYVCTGAPSLCCFRDAAAAYNLIGSATTDPETGEVTLTPDVVHKVGYAWYKQRISFARDFSVNLKLYLGSNDASGADGGSIIFQRNAAGFDATGSSGGLLGASFSPLIGVEFDDWQNPDSSYGHDIPGDHTSIFQDNVAHELTGAVCMSADCRNFEDGHYHQYEVSWTAATTTLVVRIDGLQRLSLTKDIARDVFSGDPEDIVFGFSASTGDSKNLQKFCPAAPEGFTVPRDQDDDGVDDSVDADDDNDGILDIVESPNVFGPGDPGGDHDVDGVPNWRDVDYWNDVLHQPEQCPDITAPIGECDSLPSGVDADGDGTPNHLDGDSDGDGVKDVVEAGGADANDDGIQDGCVPVTENGGCADGNLAPQDADGDGNADVYDSDGDYDGDGTSNVQDGAPKNPCVPADTNSRCGSGDADYDGVKNSVECPTSTSCEDSDDDGVPDFQDQDADNDGASDAVDDARTDACMPNAKALACPTGDADGDGVPNASDEMPSAPCVPDPAAPACRPVGGSNGSDDSGAMEPSDPCRLMVDGLGCPTGDADGDGVPNSQDTDPSDPCVPNASTLRCGTGDADGDGIDNQTECPALQSCLDSDEDGAPDYQDSDDDGDGTSTRDEDYDGDGNPANDDANNDGSPDYLEASYVDAATDADEDGLKDAQECPGEPCADTDQDGTPDNLDADDDGDGVLTAKELIDEASFGTDVDHDGHVNHLDPDADNDDLRDGREAGDVNANRVPDYLEKRFIDDDGCSIIDSHNPVAGGWFFVVFGWILTRRSVVPKAQRTSRR